MPLLDIFKKKKKPVKEEVKPAAKPPKIKAEAPAKKEKRAIIGRAYKILKTPHITEKASGLTEKNQYIFKVWPRASKTEIKKAVEDVFGVDAVSVKIIKVPKKRRRLGRISGYRAGYKKAVVRIKEGQKIEVLPR